ncbi:PLP-dependent aminotransferase family protein [Dyadobacter sp. 676]|uniref:PLP-dependent aminotransferase family protein n=1 Tax=Dyadobacter sp. 676 TaxID=3088362 RepID=A0AAU8FTS3_9BACT
MNVLSTLIAPEKGGKQPVYIQIANQLMALIKDGTLQSGYRLLSTRQLAAILNVHRRTVVQAYDELLAQGWLESQTGNGTFVARNLPDLRPVPIALDGAGGRDPLKKAGFSFDRPAHLDRAVLKASSRFHLDDGFPDPRLAPLEDLSRAYRSQLLHGNSYQRLGYGDTTGAGWLRQELSAHLNETRGLRTSVANILIVRGMIMGMYLAVTSLVKAGDYVVTDSPGWFGASMNFLQAGARIHYVPVDAHGMDVDALEEFCMKQPVRMVYVTSHHQYPTTVALRPDRRIKLLKLAEKYGFVVFEDDYDFDFHYLSKPLLPLFGADQAGMVLYCGSFTKTISPAFRIGYLVGPEDVIAHLASLRRIIDRQGDSMLENAVAELLQTGVIQRHLRKSVRVYKQRRDFFCELLRTELAGAIRFEVPDGGMAVWARFDPSIDIPELAAKAAKKDLYFSNGQIAGYPPEFRNYIRLGFASSDPGELEQSVKIIRDLL